MSKQKTKSNMDRQPNYQTCDLEEFLNTIDDDNDEFISHEQYLQTREPLPEEFISTPDEFLEPFDGKQEYARNGDITRLLQSVPGILPPVEKFPKSYIPQKPSTHPDIIMNDKIPILLSEKFFKFNADPVEETTDAKHFTEGEGEDGDSNNGICSNGYNDNNGNGKNSNGRKGSKTEVDFKRQFWSVFSDSDFDHFDFNNSDDDNDNAIPVTTVNEMQRCTISEAKPNNGKPARKYYTPYEIYMKKRGNKQ